MRLQPGRFFRASKASGNIAVLFSIFTATFTPVLGLAQETLSAEQLTQLAKPAVVRVVDGCSGTYRFYNPEWENETTFFIEGTSSIGIGSGFFVHPDGYIATSADVVKNANNSHRSCKNELFEQFLRRFEDRLGFDKGTYSEDEESRKFIENNSKLEGFEGISQVILSGGKAFDFEIKSFGIPTNIEESITGKNVAVIKIEVQNAPTLKLSGPGLPKAGSDVLVLGYPTEAEVDFLDEESSLQMSTIAGSVSAIKSTDDGVKVIQMSASVSAGISGGPVLDNSGKVIGLLSFGSLDETGTSVIPNAVSTSTLNELVWVAGIENESGVVDTLYRDGLNYFWAGDHRRAKLSFENVKALFEYHSEVDSLISEATLAFFDKENSSNKSVFSLSPWLWALILVSGAALGVAGLFLRMRKHMPQKLSVPEVLNTLSLASSEKETQTQTVQYKKLLLETSVKKQQAHRTKFNNSKVFSTAWLEVDFKGETHRLSLFSDQHKLGRDTSWADLEVPSSWSLISMRHAILQKDGLSYRIFDGDGHQHISSNGIKTENGILIDSSKGHLLTHGEQLKIGSVLSERVTITFFNPSAIEGAKKYAEP